MAQAAHITGVAETVNALRGFARRVDDGIEALVLYYGSKVLLRAKHNLEGGTSGPRRIDTGYLRARIYLRLVRMAKGAAAEVISPASYSVHVHYGTIRMVANRFLEEALAYYRADFLRAVRRLVKSAGVAL